MKTSTKWIFGIVIGVLVIAVIGLGFLAWRGFGGVWMMGERSFSPWDGPRDLPMHVMPGIHTGLFGGFFLLRWIGGWLFGLGLLALIIFGLVRLFREPRQAVPPPAPPAPSAPPAPPAPVPAPAPLVTKTCASCGKGLQEEWSHCPYCGKAVTG